jgi:hypothetical protein
VIFNFNKETIGISRECCNLGKKRYKRRQTRRIYTMFLELREYRIGNVIRHSWIKVMAEKIIPFHIS